MKTLTQTNTNSQFATIGVRAITAALALFLLFGTALFSGCGSSSKPYLGKWEVVSINGSTDIPSGNFISFGEGEVTTEFSGRKNVVGFRELINEDDEVFQLEASGHDAKGNGVTVAMVVKMASNDEITLNEISHRGETNMALRRVL
jgi:hypothetical protein